MGVTVLKLYDFLSQMVEKGAKKVNFSKKRFDIVNIYYLCSVSSLKNNGST
jgi:hypothetical protein